MFRGYRRVLSRSGAYTFWEQCWVIWTYFKDKVHLVSHLKIWCTHLVSNLNNIRRLFFMYFLPLFPKIVSIPIK